ncbi:glycosyltransferase family 1 protein [uncultured Clostridium sp.]|uniref:glycosyltransferase family 4 protein n=1 Tax=uncultured Clostridium sp. TaxID=59620 RepID=UPI0025DF3246|nr:glycosyltransferase family 1 protein [uncultured Clostridium sp.]MDU4884775.1 glycosyltransferase family 1 protein [Clostridium celatum]MDU7078012.1 glycosyltransferase family 1 protein [Clostridium celatum]
MKFSIDARGINLYKGSGIGTYTENLLRELLNIDTKNNYSIFWTGENYENYKKDNSKIIFTSRKHGTFYENYYYPNYIEENNIDMHHIPQNGIGLNELYTSPLVVTIHDLIPYILPETVGRGYLQRFLRDMPLIVNNSKIILTVSEYSKKDIMKFFPFVNEEKIFVTPLAANKSYKPLNKSNCIEYIKNKYSIDSPFILYIGGFSTRKNVKELIIAFNKIKKSLKKDYKLVLCGSIKDEGVKLQNLCKELLIDDKIIFTGFIPDDELPLFYNAAELFIYPSLYEGFGLPPLEAMSCATPVITSNLTSIPEVTKDCAILIDPFNKDELASSILNLLNSESSLQEYSQKGYKNSLNFTWKNTAIATLKAYEHVFKNINN